MAKKTPLVGLDIGTTKVCAIAGAVDEDGEVHIVGVGIAPSYGLRKGVVVDLDSTTRAIEEAVERAERMAGAKITGALVGVSGEHIASQNTRGVVAVARGDREIGEGDVARVIEAARMAAIPAGDREIIHLLPRDFIVDGQDGVRNPVGMFATRLEVEAHIVTGASTLLANLLKCVQRAGLEARELVLEPLASGEAVLTQAERDLGVAVIDIGGGTTSVGVFASGSLCHTCVVPVGGNHITNDIAVGLRTPIAEAERLKLRWGGATAAAASEGELIEVTNVGERDPRVLPRRVLCEIIEPRVAEILSLVRSQLRRSGYGHLVASGVVLTGGTSLLQGLSEPAGRLLELPARLGAPARIAGLSDTVSSPAYATGVGLVLHGARLQQGVRPLRSPNGVGFFGKLRGFLREFVQGS